MDIWLEAEAGNTRSVQAYIDQREVRTLLHLCWLSFFCFLCVIAADVELQDINRMGPNNRRRTPLHCAAKGGKPTCVDALIKVGSGGACMKSRL